MKIVLHSKDLFHPACIAEIEEALMALDGVQKAVVDFFSGHIEIKYDPGKVSCDMLIMAVHSVGYSSKVALPKLFRPANGKSNRGTSPLDDL